MVSDAQKRATAKYKKDNVKTVQASLSNEYMLKIQQSCLSCGLKPGAAARLYLQAVGDHDPDALALLRKLAYSDSNPEA